MCYGSIIMATSDNYRVVLKEDRDEVEIGSIGVPHGMEGTEYWAWGIDTVIPMRDTDTQGSRARPWPRLTGARP